jgi:hypothetical protein
MIQPSIRKDSLSSNKIGAAINKRIIAESLSKHTLKNLGGKVSSN